MKFVIDTNILIFALIRDSTTRKILFNSPADFYYPAPSLKEIENNRSLIIEKSGLT